MGLGAIRIYVSRNILLGQVENYLGLTSGLGGAWMVINEIFCRMLVFESFPLHFFDAVSQLFLNELDGLNLIEFVVFSAWLLVMICHFTLLIHQILFALVLACIVNLALI